MRYTEEEILNDFNHFKAYEYGVSRIIEGVNMLGSPCGYSRNCDYTYKLISEMCPNLTLEFIATLDEAVDDIVRERTEYHWDNKIPYPKDFDYYKDTFPQIKDRVKLIRDKRVN